MNHDLRFRTSRTMLCDTTMGMIVARHHVQLRSGARPWIGVLYEAAVVSSRASGPSVAYSTRLYHQWPRPTTGIYLTIRILSADQPTRLYASNRLPICCPPFLPLKMAAVT